MSKHLIGLYQTSIKNLKKNNRNKLYCDAYIFALKCYDFFGGLSENTNSSINRENMTIELYMLFVYYINSYIILLLYQLYCYLYLCLYLNLCVIKFQDEWWSYMSY